jgi:hypothetical protein
LDVAGVKDGAIWLVQTVWCKDVNDSVVRRSAVGKNSLFKSRVFNDPALAGNSVQALYMTYDLVRKAFPDVHVYTLGLAMHPDSPDFELYQIDIIAERPTRIVLREDRVRRNAIDFTDRLLEDIDALLMLPNRVNDDAFRCVPPCRGGRTLAVLAATAKRQLCSKELLLFKEQQFRRFLKDDYNYEVTRDKVRHDLVDRLVVQGFMRKWGSYYFLTVKGVARYQYCLAKYTTLGDSDSMQVLERCTDQRDRIVKQLGCRIGLAG